MSNFSDIHDSCIHSCRHKLGNTQCIMLPITSISKLQGSKRNISLLFPTQINTKTKRNANHISLSFSLSLSLVVLSSSISNLFVTTRFVLSSPQIHTSDLCLSASLVIFCFLIYEFISGFFIPEIEDRGGGTPLQSDFEFRYPIDFDFYRYELFLLLIDLNSISEMRELGNMVSWRALENISLQKIREFVCVSILYHFLSSSYLDLVVLCWFKKQWSCFLRILWTRMNHVWFRWWCCD